MIGVLFSSKQLDALLYDWVDDILNPQNGYPSATNEYRLSQSGIRVSGLVLGAPLFIYRATPQVKALNGFIVGLPLRQKNPLVGKYLYNMKLDEIAVVCECSKTTVHRNLSKSRTLLIDKMEHFNLKLSTVVMQCGTTP